MWVAAILCLVRVGGIWGGCWLGCWLGGTPAEHRRQMWYGMITQVSLHPLCVHSISLLVQHQAACISSASLHCIQYYETVNAVAVELSCLLRSSQHCCIISALGLGVKHRSTGYQAVYKNSCVSLICLTINLLHCLADFQSQHRQQLEPQRQMFCSSVHHCLAFIAWGNNDKHSEVCSMLRG